ncbi:tyrosine-type recombinase/integrase [Phyllobacterium lublinensis]|uniref:tyrosine-type recombinase/integrase n=1 Tax=Phyllobacterium lublinensis TaxID=2875708 RepID=UPI001CCB8536|nr:integrase family protein [Phyllobacterium sp. 2063]MBZ9654353.1 integrase family protein [Phyllobacterium sp. 2063]
MPEKRNKVFNDKFLASLKNGPKRIEREDGIVPGFVIILQPAPSKTRTWAERYVFNGEREKYTIGDAATISVGDARKEARWVLDEVEKGRNPQAERRAAKQAARADPVAAAQTVDPDEFETVATGEFMKLYAEKRNRDNTLAAQRRYIRKLAKRWKGRSIHSITRRDIAAAINAEAVTAPQSSLGMHSLCTTMFKWLEGVGRIDTNPAISLPKPARVNRRTRVLALAEVRWLWKASDRLGYPANGFIKLLILTGARRSEIAELPWSELDFRAMPVRWNLPAARAKNKTALTLSLPPLAVEIINALPRHGTGKPVFLFSMDGKTAYRSFGYLKQQIDAIMLTVAREEAVASGIDPDEVEIAPWTYHDCRRSLNTHMIDCDIALPHIVESLLNHKIVGTAAHYNHAKLLLQTGRALADWAAFIKKIVDQDEGADVVTLPMNKVLNKHMHFQK